MPFSTFSLPVQYTWPISEHTFNQTKCVTSIPSETQLQDVLIHLKGQVSRLRTTPIAEIINTIHDVAQSWSGVLTNEQTQLLTTIATISGYSPAMVEHIIKRMCQDWHAEALWQRLEMELSDPLFLDTWRPYGTGLARLYGPTLTWHIAAGNVPGLAVQSLIDSLLIKSPALVKPATSEPLFAAWWVKHLSLRHPLLAQSQAVVWWPQKQKNLENIAIQHSSAIQINGSTQTIQTLQPKIPSTKRFIHYGSRISCALVTHSMLEHADLAHNLVYDAIVFDQQGCVSPQIIFVEASIPELATLVDQLTQALGQYQKDLPQAAPTIEQASVYRVLQETLEWRQIAGENLQVAYSVENQWSVIIDESAQLQPVVCPRTMILRPISTIQTALQLLEPMHQYLQSIALAAQGLQAVEIADQLAQLGITRITRPGQQPWPSIGWLHDGRKPLDHLGYWSQWE